MVAPGKRLLVIDDDVQIRKLLDEYLTEVGFDVTVVGDGASARSQFRSSEIDLILLDIVLPDTDGITLAKEFRETSDTPIVMLTVKGEELERIMGLELGADDYVTKPFSPRELAARVNAIFRRIDAGKERDDAADERETATVYHFGDWSLDPATRRISRTDGEQRRLTAAEFRLLMAFLRNPRHVLSREQLLTLSRADPSEVYDRSIDYQILRLRRKLDDVPRSPKLIKTEHGIGYVFDAMVTKTAIPGAPVPNAQPYT